MSLFNKLLGLKDVEIRGQTKVKSLKKDFKESFGTEIRVYKTANTGKGSRPADDGSTLASIATGGKKITSMTIKKGDMVGNIEEQFAEKLGVGIQIMGPDGKKFAPNDMKLKDIVKNMSA
ncbi:MAG: hypothetical protein P8M26_10390 [Gammaproteobacteria bacterium]|jgi:hypothetical protein|nr:hypothetical protein [Gammaproteobacteria bacterium]